MAESQQGWVKTHRQIRFNWIWKEKPFSLGQAWIDLILSANHKDSKIIFDKRLTKIKRGTFITSELKLMEQWGWSKSKVRKFLQLLQSDEMIVKKSDRKKTTITICNYDTYQDSETTEEQVKNHRKTSERPLKDTNKNDKNDNNLFKEEDKGNQEPKTLKYINNPANLFISYWNRNPSEFEVQDIRELLNTYSIQEIQKAFHASMEQSIFTIAYLKGVLNKNGENNNGTSSNKINSTGSGKNDSNGTSGKFNYID